MSYKLSLLPILIGFIPVLTSCNIAYLPSEYTTGMKNKYTDLPFLPHNRPVLVTEANKFDELNYLKVTGFKFNAAQYAPIEEINRGLLEVGREIGADAMLITDRHLTTAVTTSTSSSNYVSDSPTTTLGAVLQLTNLLITGGENGTTTNTEIKNYQEIKVEAIAYPQNISTISKYIKKVNIYTPTSQGDSLISEAGLGFDGKVIFNRGNKAAWQDLMKYDLGYLMDEKNANWKYRFDQFNNLVRVNTATGLSCRIIKSLNKASLRIREDTYYGRGTTHIEVNYSSSVKPISKLTSPEMQYPYFTTYVYDTIGRLMEQKIYSSTDTMRAPRYKARYEYYSQDDLARIPADHLLTGRMILLKDFAPHYYDKIEWLNGQQATENEEIVEQVKQETQVAEQIGSGNEDNSDTQGETLEQEVQTTIHHSDVDTQLPKALKPRPDAIAVVIGNRNYFHKDVPEVAVAQHDAQSVKEYLISGLGYRPENIIYVEDATQASLLAIFGSAQKHKGKLYNYVKPGKSEVFVYYSGHGFPDLESQDGYLMPVDADPSLASLNGYPISQLLANLAQVPYASLTLMIDACFSGNSQGGMLIKNASPVIIKPVRKDTFPANAHLYFSTSENQLASWNVEQNHSLFTYFMLKGLQGHADLDNNKSITHGELSEYVTKEVWYMARREYNREQLPEYFGEAKGVFLEEAGN